MNEIWQIWIFLLAMGLINYFLRVFPLLIPNQWQTDTNNQIITFLEYAVFAIIGGVISSALFSGISETGLNQLNKLIDIHNLIKLLTITFVFGIYLYLKQFILSFVFGLIFYQILTYFFP